MTLLTDDQRERLRAEIGANPTDEIVDSKFARLGSWRAVAVEVLERRLTDLIDSPATFSVGGEYGQSTSANIAALERKIKRLRAEAAAEGEGGGLMGRVLTRECSSWDR